MMLDCGEQYNETYESSITASADNFVRLNLNIFLIFLHASLFHLNIG